MASPAANPAPDLVVDWLTEGGANSIRPVAVVKKRGRDLVLLRQVSRRGNPRMAEWMVAAHRAWDLELLERERAWLEYRQMVALGL